MNVPTDTTNNNNNNNIDDWNQYVLNLLPSARNFFETDSNNNIKNKFKEDSNNKIIFEPFSFDNSGKHNINTNGNIDNNNNTINTDVFISLFNIKSAKKIDYIKFDPYKLYSEDFFNLKKKYINEVKFLNNDNNIGEKSDFFLNIGGGKNDSEKDYMIKTRTERLKNRKNQATNDTSILIFGLVDITDKPIDGTIMYTKTDIKDLNNLKDLSTNIGVIDNTSLKNLKKIGNVLGRGAMHTAKGAIIAKDYLTKKGIEGALHTAKGAIIAKDYLTKKGIEGALHTAKGAKIAKDYLTQTFLQNITKNSSNTGGKRKKYNHRLTKKINTKNCRKSKKYRR